MRFSQTVAFDLLGIIVAYAGSVPVLGSPGIPHGGNQLCILYQGAELLLGSVMMRPHIGFEVFHTLVFYGEPLQNDDSDVAVAQVPELTLSQFHSVNVAGVDCRIKKIPLPLLARRDVSGPAFF